MQRVYVIAATLLVAMVLTAQADDNMKAFPPADAGMVRYVLQLPPLADETAAKVELIVGKTVITDSANHYFFAGKIEEQNIEGWGFTRYVVGKLGPMAGTLMAADPNAPQVSRFITLGGEAYLIRYNSKLPVVVYVPQGVEVHYRVWTAPPEAKTMESRADAPPLTPGQPVPVVNSHGEFHFIQIDSQTSRLLAPHAMAGTFDVLNLTDGTLVKQCAIDGAEDVAVDAAHGKYYVSGNRYKRKMIVLDSKTFEVTGETQLPSFPDLLTFDPKNGLVYIAHDDVGEVWAVDAASNKIVTTIQLTNKLEYRKPEGLVCDPEGDRVFVNVLQTSEVVVIDAASNKVVAHWPMAPAREPHGMALDLPSHRLFVACSDKAGAGKLIAMDATSGKIVSTVDTAPNVDQIAYDAELKRVYCASRDGVMSVIQVKEDSLVSLGDVATQKGAHSVAVDLKTHDVWTGYASAGKNFILKLTVPK